MARGRRDGGDLAGIQSDGEVQGAGRRGLRPWPWRSSASSQATERKGERESQGEGEEREARAADLLGSGGASPVRISPEARGCAGKGREEHHGASGVGCSG